MTMPIDRPSILIIEDVEEDIDILNTILKDEFQLHIAKTAEDGLKTAVEQRPDMMLLDIVLPDKTGFAVLEEWKASSETAEIPVIVITSAGSAKNEERALNLGAVDFIIKPFHHAVITARIRAHMRILYSLRTAERIGWTDAATGIPNRNRFEKQLALEWKRAQREQKPLGLLLIGVDHFKDDNDAHMSRTKDVVLQKMVEVIFRTLKRSEDFVFRYDSDRFVVLLPDTDNMESITLAEAIKRGIETMQVRVHDSVLAPVTVCIGVATSIPKTGDVPDSLLIHAEQMLDR